MSLDRFDLQILGMQLQDELRAERASREHMAYMKAYAEQTQRLAERSFQQSQLEMQRAAQKEDLAYMALAYAPRRTNNKVKKKVIIPSIEVNVVGRDLEYFMTNDQDMLDDKLDELGFRSWTTSDWFLNLELAQTVRRTMEQVGAIYSLTMDAGFGIMNYWAPEISPVPFSCYLNESMYKEE